MKEREMTYEMERCLVTIEKKARRNYRYAKMAIHFETACFLEENGFKVIYPSDNSVCVPKALVKVMICWDNSKKNMLSGHFSKMSQKYQRKEADKARTKQRKQKKREREFFDKEERYECLNCIYDDVCEDCSGHRCPIFASKA